MSLSVDGVWKTGVWAQTVWADGVWREGSAAISPFETILFDLSVTRDMSSELEIDRELELSLPISRLIDF